MGTYRDDLEAAQARAAALDREVAELREKNAELEKRATQAEPATPKPEPRRPRRVNELYVPSEPAYEGTPWPWWRKAGLVGFIVCIVACAISITQTRDDTMEVWDYIMLSGAILGGFFGWLALGAPAET